MKIGTLVHKLSDPGVTYRVTSKIGPMVRLLPFQRQGKEVWITKIKGVWCDSEGKAWSTL
jgi:hypothetical protein